MRLGEAQELMMMEPAVQRTDRDGQHMRYRVGFRLDTIEPTDRLD